MADVDLSERRPFWDDVRVDRLKAMWAAGAHASQIASEFGVSRNAVCGKIHRLRLPTRAAQERKLPAPRIRPSRAEPKPKHNQTPPELHAKRAQEAEGITADKFDARIPKRQRKTIMQLTAETCRWPVGDPQDRGFYFCGGKPMDGLPYCGVHCRRGYNGLPKKPQHEFRGSK